MLIKMPSGFFSEVDLSGSTQTVQDGEIISCGVGHSMRPCLQSISEMQCGVLVQAGHVMVEFSNQLTIKLIHDVRHSNVFRVSGQSVPYCLSILY